MNVRTEPRFVDTDQRLAMVPGRYADAIAAVNDSVHNLGAVDAHLEELAERLPKAGPGVGHKARASGLAHVFGQGLEPRSRDLRHVDQDDPRPLGPLAADGHE